MDLLKLLFKDSFDHLYNFKQAPETPENQLSVGWNGDVPIFPPILILTFLFITLLTKLYPDNLTDYDLFYEKTSPLAREMILMCGFAYLGLIVSSEEWALFEVGTGAAFLPVVKLATEDHGVFAYSRNCEYMVDVFVFGPAIATFFDSFLCFILLTAGMGVYLHFWVVPAEEKLLEDLFGEEYTQYCERIPRYFEHAAAAFYFCMFILVVHFIEFLWNFNKLKSRKGRCMFEHFYFTMLYGYFYLKHSVKRDKEWRAVEEKTSQRRKLRSYNKIKRVLN